MKRILNVLLPGSLLLGAVVACGSRGDPLPPLRPSPPPVPGLQVSQRGTDVFLQFRALPPTVQADGQSLTLDALEVLVYAERYPAITAELLAATIQRERRRRLEEAREALEQEERTLALQREAEAAAAAARAEAEAEAAAVEAAGVEAGDKDEVPILSPIGEDPVTRDPAAEDAVEDTEADPLDDPAAEEDEQEEELLPPEELLLRGVPAATLREWREGGVFPDIVVEGARRLEETLDELWDDLDMPSAIVDLRRPPDLPAPDVILQRAAAVAASLQYERTVDTSIFLERAAVARTIPMTEIASILQGEFIETEYVVGSPPLGGLRTRYAFAVRAVSDRGREGVVSQVVSLAPSPVPLAPGSPDVSLTAYGVVLEWAPPAGDLSGRLLDSDDLRYNVYRMAVNGSEPLRKLTSVPIEDTSFIDRSATWGEAYEYEVRAVNASSVPNPVDPTSVTGTRLGSISPSTIVSPAAPVRVKESNGARSPAVRPEDKFPPTPATNLVAARVGGQVTLRWNPSVATDLTGYRVYRHRLPSPEIPSRGGPPVVIPESVSDNVVLAASGLPGEVAHEIGDATEGPVAEPGSGPPQGGDSLALPPAREYPGLLEVTLNGLDLDDGEGEEAELLLGALATRLNPLVRRGWELLTSEPTLEVRIVDPDASAAVGWVYLVEVVDETGNVSLLIVAGVPEEQRP